MPDLPVPAAQTLPAKAEEGFVCVECQTGPDLKAEFEILRRGREGYRYAFPCKGHREGCKGSVVLGRKDIEDLVSLHEAGRAHLLLDSLEDAFQKNIEDATAGGHDPGERSAATHAAVAVAKLKLQVAGIIQKQGAPVTVQNQVAIGNFSPDGPVAKRLMEIAKEQFAKSLPTPSSRDAPDPISQAAVEDISVEGIL